MDKRENKNGSSCGSAETRKHMAGTVGERSVIHFAKFLSNAQFPSLFSFDYFVARLAIVQKFAVAKYLLLSIAKLTAHESTLESIDAANEIERKHSGSFIFKSMSRRSA